MAMILSLRKSNLVFSIPDIPILKEAKAEYAKLH
jgi:hypothetical protein